MSIQYLLRLAKCLLIAFFDRVVPGSRIFYVGNYQSWDAASAACRGYGDKAILKKVRQATREVVAGRALYERDSVLFHTPEFNWPLLTLVFKQQAERPGSVTVLDFGGALGSTYYQHRSWLTKIPGLRWCVVEQPHYYECGKEEFETDQLFFYRTIEECLGKEKVSLALFSSVLPYLSDPWTVMQKIAAAEVQTVMIDQTLVWRSRRKVDRIVLQHVPKSIYEALYPVHIVDHARYAEVLTGKYDLITLLPGRETSVVLLYPWQVACFEGSIYELKR